MVIGKTRTFAQSFMKKPNLILRVLDDRLLSPAHPPGKATQLKRQRMNRRTIYRTEKISFSLEATISTNLARLIVSTDSVRSIFQTLGDRRIPAVGSAGP